MDTQQCPELVKVRETESVNCDELSESLRSEFSQLKGVTYVDHAGSTLYARSQVDAWSDELKNSLLGNPHSRNASSTLTTDLLDQARIRVARHFNTDLDSYGVIFTSGATGALRLLAESFAWTTPEPKPPQHPNNDHRSDTSAPSAHFMYLQDNHTSVLGIRQVAAQFGCGVTCLSASEWEASLTSDIDNDLIHQRNHRDDDSSSSFSDNGDDDFGDVANCLVAFPAQSNFCGRRYPLNWVQDIRGGCLQRHLPAAAAVKCDERRRKWRWSVLLDAAALVGTAQLNLREVQPDFVCLSFYKMFGLPSGLGALLVRRPAATHLLETRYFGGGTVLVAPAADTHFHVMRPSLEQRFEAGTVSYLDILALRHGFDALERLGGGMERIGRNTFGLARRLQQGLAARCHGNGRPVATIYCHDSQFQDAATQGATVNFNLLRADGSHVGFSQVEKVAAVHSIHLRTGCMCNPGACQAYLRLTLDDVRRHFQAGHVCGDDRDLVDGRPTGSVRVSFGYMSCAGDVRRILAMIDACFVERTIAATLINTQICPDTAVYSTPEQDAGQQWSVVNDCRCAAHGLQRCARLHIGSLTLFPVKSCGAFHVASWELGTRGLLYDRDWMIVTEAGVSLTQKREPRLCLIRPEVDLSGGRLLLRYQGVADISVPLAASQHNDQLVSGTVSNKMCQQTKVCGDRVEATDCGEPVAQWLSQVVGVACRLVRQSEHSIRTGSGSKKVASPGGAFSSLSLANEAQYLLLNRASGAALADKITQKKRESGQLDKRRMTLKEQRRLHSCSEHDSGAVADNDGDVNKLLARFRGNMEVWGAAPFAEEHWMQLRIGQRLYQVQGPCSRCQMVCINQESAARTAEPLVTLAATRGRNGINFGVYLCSDGSSVPRRDDANNDASPVIRVGDPVVVVSSSVATPSTPI